MGVLGLLGFVALIVHPSLIAAQSTLSCVGPSPSGGIRPSIASGYQYQVIATGLSTPRGLLLDAAGNLLVVQSGTGRVVALSLTEQNGCVTAGSPVNVTPSLSLNHGIELSADGRTLYASNANTAYSWSYNSTSRQVTGQREVVTNMTTSDHTTRTLLLSRKVPGMLVINRGSTSNLDLQAATLDSGHSQVKAFNMNNISSNAYDFNAAGLRMGWGLRNDVGVGEHPISGGIYSVENSADNIQRYGVDVHQNNPGEEMNFLGYLNGTTYSRQGQSFGYPWCYSAWDLSSLPNNANLSVGSQFAISATPDTNNQNQTDAYCAAQTPARLVFAAHMAPLDIKFNNSGTEAWITFHGSWNRNPPQGYKLSVVAFNSNGQPVDPSNSTTAAKDIFWNQDTTRCPGSCFRPVGMAIDSRGRIFMSSDASNEIYMISKIQSTATTPSNSASSAGTPSSTGTGASASSTRSAATPNLVVPSKNSWDITSLLSLSAYIALLTAFLT